MTDKDDDVTAHLIPGMGTVKGERHRAPSLGGDTG